MGSRYDKLTKNEKINLIFRWCDSLTNGHQKRFAEILGVNPATLSYWRNGRQSPNSAAFENLARALNLSADDILAGPNASQSHLINTGIPQAHKLGVTIPLPDKLTAKIDAIAARLGLTRDQIVTAACWRLVRLDPPAQIREIADALRSLADQIDTERRSQ